MNILHARHANMSRMPRNPGCLVLGLLVALLTLASASADAFHRGDDPRQSLRGHVRILEDKNRSLDAESAMAAASISPRDDS